MTKNNSTGNFHGPGRGKKTAARMGLYAVDPDRIGAGPPQKAKYTESKKSYFVRKYMEIHSAANARVQSEIDDVTRQMIDVEQQLLVAQKTNGDVTSLKEELATLKSKRKAKKGDLVFALMEKSPTGSDQ